MWGNDLEVGCDQSDHMVVRLNPRIVLILIYLMTQWVI